MERRDERGPPPVTPLEIWRQSGGGILRVGCQNMWVFNTLRPQKYTHFNIARIWGTLGIAQIDIGGGSAPLDHPQGPLRGRGESHVGGPCHTARSFGAGLSIGALTDWAARPHGSPGPYREPGGTLQGILKHCGAVRSHGEALLSLAVPCRALRSPGNTVIHLHIAGSSRGPRV